MWEVLGCVGSLRECGKSQGVWEAAPCVSSRVLGKSKGVLEVPGCVGRSRVCGKSQGGWEVARCVSPRVCGKPQGVWEASGCVGPRVGGKF